MVHEHLECFYVQDQAQLNRGEGCCLVVMLQSYAEYVFQAPLHSSVFDI